MSQAEVLLYLLLNLVIIILAARSCGWLARRWGQPAVIGEITAGILLGPTVLGRISPGLPEVLFPSAVPLPALANLGLIFFMFLVGLELDTGLIMREGRRALRISLSGIAAPLLLGIVIGLPLASVNAGGVFLTEDRPSSAMAFPLFLGAAMCITAFPVLARILVERGLYKTGLGTTALCAAAVDDVFAWILLAAVVGLTRTGSMAQAGIAFLLTLLFVAFMILVGRWLLRLLAQRYEATGQLTADQVAIVLTGVLLSALTTEWIGIHAIFGAFIFGAVMPKHSRMTQEVIDKIEDFTVIVFLPVFFCVAGLRTNLFALNSLELLGWLILILAAAIGGKLLGCGLAARLNGFSVNDSLVLGTLMNTRGLTELVILTIGQSLGVLSDRTFAMMVIMALATTFMATPIINRLIPRKRMVQMLAGGEPAPVRMRVLVALGNPVNAPSLVEAGIGLIGSERPAELLLVRLIATARAPEFRTGLQDEESQVNASLEAMRALVREAEAAGLSARPVSFLSDAVAPDLAYIAETQNCDTILLGWHRPSLARHVIRTNVHFLFQKAPGAVVVFVDRHGNGVRQGADRPVLVALTGDSNDAAAMQAGLRVAEQLASFVELVGYVGRKDRQPPSAEKLAATASQLQQAGTVRVASRVVCGDARSVIVSESSRAAAVVVALGSDWPTGDFGQPASALTEATDCPVLVVRGRLQENHRDSPASD
jgi:Kef-type K+ transport system membrane component KefB/nucleotide-binding universal stress UspA family protein